MPTMENPLSLRKAMALVLRENGHTYTEITAQTGLAKTTLTRLFKDPRAAGIPLSMVNALRQVEDAKLTIIAHKAWDYAIEHDEPFEKASLQQLITAGAIVTDKRELLAGRPTQRLEASMSDAEIHAELKRLADKYSDLTGGKQIDYDDVVDAEVVGDADAIAGVDGGGEAISDGNDSAGRRGSGSEAREP
jgi:hypothetical protein